MELHLAEMDKEHSRDERLPDLIKHNIQDTPVLWFWGESALPYFFNVINYLEHNEMDDVARGLLVAVSQAIINSNPRNSKIGLPSPYYSASQILEGSLGLGGEDLDLTEFPGSSYMLRSVISMLARRNEREVLEQEWRKLSHIRLKEFRLDNELDVFSWRTELGANHWEFPKHTQSWSELESQARDNEEIPELFKIYRELLRFFTLVCPHRADERIISLLDNDKYRKE